MTEHVNAQELASQNEMNPPHEEFMKITHHIKKSLQSLMLEVASLEVKLAQKI